jgi:hypothetical protein
MFGIPGCISRLVKVAKAWLHSTHGFWDNIDNMIPDVGLAAVFAVATAVGSAH